MKLRDPRGFTLLELMVVLIVLGTMFAFALPGFLRYAATQNVKGAAANIAGQLRLARQKAISTGNEQTLHFIYQSGGCDYHIHNANTPIGAKWNLPNGITYYNPSGGGFYYEYRMAPDGHCKDSGMVIVQNARGLRDTVSVELSGLILYQ